MRLDHLLSMEYPREGLASLRCGPELKKSRRGGEAKWNKGEMENVARCFPDLPKLPVTPQLLRSGIDGPVAQLVRALC